MRQKGLVINILIKPKIKYFFNYMDLIVYSMI